MTLELTRAQLLPVFEPYAAAIHTLWTALRSSTAEGVPQRLGFTGYAGGEGTSTVAACTAIGLALHGGREVVLVEANGNDPDLAGRLGLPAGPGFEELRRGLVSPEEALRETDVAGLRLLLFGGGDERTARQKAPAASLRGPRTVDLVKLWERLAADGAHILVDAPHVHGNPSAIPILASLTGSILVLNARRTRKPQADRAMDALATAGVPLIGTILNRCDTAR